MRNVLYAWYDMTHDMLDNQRLLFPLGLQVLRLDWGFPDSKKTLHTGINLLARQHVNKSNIFYGFPGHVGTGRSLCGIVVLHPQS
jgi:hypothetical protein